METLGAQNGQGLKRDLVTLSRDLITLGRGLVTLARVFDMVDEDIKMSA